MKRAAIILAGGKGERFQRPNEAWKDKALVKLRGKAMIEHIVETCNRAVDEVLIVVNDEERRSVYSRLIGSRFEDVKIVVDEKIAKCAGPLVGIMTGLKNATSYSCIILPCDVPYIEKEIVDLILRYTEDSDAVVPTWPSGKIEPLLAGYRKEMALAIATALCLLGRRRPDDLIRGALKVLFMSIVDELRDIGDYRRAFVNINYPNDLEKSEIEIMEGPIAKSFSLMLNPIGIEDIQDFSSILERAQCGTELMEPLEKLVRSLEEKGTVFWTAALLEKMGTLTRNKSVTAKAADCYDQEVKMYEKRDLNFLASHALLDEILCWQKVGNSDRAKSLTEKLRSLRAKMGICYET